METTVLSPSRVGKIVVRGVNWLGDAVMTIPALVRLRERYPEAHLTLFTDAKLGSLWTHFPSLDAVVTFRRTDGLWHSAKQLRAGNYDLGVAFPNSHRSALELWLAGVPRRLGVTAPFRSWMLTHPVRPRPGMPRMRKRTPKEARYRVARNMPPDPPPPREAHQLYDYLHLVTALGASREPLAPRLPILESERTAFRGRLGSGPETTWLGLNAGAAYGPAKRWPLDRFIAVAREMHRRAGCRWMILGGPEDVEIARALEAALADDATAKGGAQGPLNLAGRLSLRELCVALAHCRAVLTNDTGPMHVAAAVGVPVVVPFGSTSPELTGPGLPGDSRHRILRRPVPCSPCFLKQCPLELQCLRGISVEEVIAALDAFVQV